MDKILRKGGKRKGLTERTLVFLKPEAVMRGLMGEIISRIERKGLIIAAMKLLQTTRKQAEKIYEVHKGKNFYEPLIDHVTSGPILAMVIEGPNAVSVLRNMIGKTNPIEAQPGTVRGDFALNVRKNMIHASDNLENAKKEIEILFREDEILEYRKPTEAQYMF
jgi:nucleoside-diphosphate kinase